MPNTGHCWVKTSPCSAIYCVVQTLATGTVTPKWHDRDTHKSDYVHYQRVCFLGCIYYLSIPGKPELGSE